MVFFCLLVCCCCCLFLFVLSDNTITEIWTATLIYWLLIQSSPILFLCPLKTSVFSRCQGVQKWNIGLNWVENEDTAMMSLTKHMQHFSVCKRSLRSQQKYNDDHGCGNLRLVSQLTLALYMPKILAYLATFCGVIVYQACGLLLVMGIFFNVLCLTLASVDIYVFQPS